jgi:chitinase
LQHFCENTDVDIIPLGFMNIYMAQGNGYPGTNFGSSCWNSNYTAPGYGGTNDHTKDDLKTDCPSMVSGIKYCRDHGKKILLSLGGAVAKGVTPYALTSVDDATNMADFLWSAFGPKDPAWTGPRPFDYAYTGDVNSVDGFDFDIEHINVGT